MRSFAMDRTIMLFSRISEGLAVFDVFRATEIITPGEAARYHIKGMFFQSAVGLASKYELMTPEQVQSIKPWETYTDAEMALHKDYIVLSLEKEKAIAALQEAGLIAKVPTETIQLVGGTQRMDLERASIQPAVEPS